MVVNPFSFWFLIDVALRFTFFRWLAPGLVCGFSGLKNGFSSRSPKMTNLRFSFAFTDA